ncbi:MAG TPA: 1,4-alpha-glucan branching enzyme, partial [Pseudonocardia sp.]|nr:1,4-alpha-glucan branching enzyme [Pseudonocardia sp.]
FNFGRKEVVNFLISNALFWLDKYHIDGLRVDAVASMLYLDYSRKEGEWVPNKFGGRENLDAVKFLQELNATVYKHHPGSVMIAEESTAWPGVTRPTHLGGLGFGFKWNMGWMHDTLNYIGHNPVHRAFHHNEVTFSLVYAWSENFVLPLSHDEVVHGKGSLWTRMPGDAWNKSANLRALLAYMWAHPGKQLLFQGGEFGQEREWSESRSIDWHLLDDPLHAGVKTLVGDLNRAYRSQPALWTRDSTPEGFSWIDANDASGNVLSFLRHGVDADGRPTVLACIANFSGSPKRDYRVGLPFAGRWREVLNTDAQIYGGSGVGNLGSVEAEQAVWHGRPASAVLQLPPAGVLWLVPEPGAGPVRRRAGATSTAAGPAVAAAGPVADAPDLGAEVPSSDTPARTPTAAEPAGTSAAVDERAHGDAAGTEPAPRPAPGTADDSDVAAEVPSSDADVRPSAVAGPAATTTGASAPVTTSATDADTGPAWAPPAPRPTPGTGAVQVPAADAHAPGAAPQHAASPDGPGATGWTIATPATTADETGPSAAATGLPTASGEQGSSHEEDLAPLEPAADLAGTDAVPDAPAPGTDSVLDDGPAAPVTSDAPADPAGPDARES